MDALGRDGFVFDRAMATGPVTTESFPGILAGRLSADTVAGSTLFQKSLPEDAPTIAGQLESAGYDTVGVISNPRIGSHVGTDRGFETFRNLRTGGETDDEGESDTIRSALQIGDRLYRLRERLRDLESVPYRYELPFLGFRTYQYLTGWPSVRGEEVIDSFIAELTETSGPFFGWTHLMDVHGPIHPQTVIDGGLMDAGPLAQFRSHARRASNVHDPATQTRYDSAVRYVDTQLQRLVDWLRDANLYEETALVVTADHGEALYDRGIYGHPQHYTYEELLGVPLVVRVPGRDGDRIERPMSLGWLHELIAELAGVGEMDAPLTSEDSRHLSPEASHEPLLLADSISPQGHSVVARSGDVKYVVQTDDLSGSDDPTVQPTGTYRLADDPAERVQSDRDDSSLVREANRRRIDPEELRQSSAGPVSAATKDRLKQLGYAE